MLEKVKAEIKRLMHQASDMYQYGLLTKEQEVCIISQMSRLLSFIESLEKKQVIDEGKDEIDEGFTRMMLNESTPKIKGWVARDDDRTLTFFFSKPHRACYTNDKIYFEDELEDGMIPWVWYALKNSNQEYILLPTTMFSDLEWEDEPIEVELTINRV